MSTDHPTTYQTLQAVLCLCEREWRARLTRKQLKQALRAEQQRHALTQAELEIARDTIRMMQDRELCPDCYGRKFGNH